MRLIREAQPHGPYILFGLCVAGVIAYEAAQQLRQAGESVPLVVMVDAWAPGYTTLRIGDRKVRRQAEKALTALDRLKACANADWRADQFDRIGFFGFSLGGSTAAEAGTFDPRVVAVANLDGWLFGRAGVWGSR